MDDDQRRERDDTAAAASETGDRRRRGATLIQALNRALHEAMEADDTVVVLGEDVGEDEGIFRLTEGLLDRFGGERVIDTPLAEAAIVGGGVGMAIGGLKPVCEIQFSGFNYHAMHQLESHVARFRWRTRGRFPLPMVIRMPYGAGVRALEHHSESKEAFFAHTPGLKMVIPSSPSTARALLASAIADPDPVILYEPKALYRGEREELPDADADRIAIGEARLVRPGDAITLITYGAMLPRTLAAADELSERDGVACEVIDLLSISPLDEDRIVASVRKTGRALVVHEAHRSFGPGAEIVARLVERCFYHLEAPIERITGFDVTVPYFAREQQYLPDARRIAAATRRMLADEPPETAYVDRVQT